MNVELKPNLKLMSLGTDCLLKKAFLDITEGPCDESGFANPNYLYCLKDKTFLKKFLTSDYRELKSTNPWFYEKEFFIKDLGMLITHGDYTDEDFKKRYVHLTNAFYDFYNHINEEDYYFIFYIRYNFSDKRVQEFKDALEYLGILDKTIVFGNKDFSETFPNFIFLGDLNLKNMPHNKDILISTRVFNKNLIALRNLLREKGYATINYEP